MPIYSDCYALYTSYLSIFSRSQFARHCKELLYSSNWCAGVCERVLCGESVFNMTLVFDFVPGRTVAKQ